MKKFLFVALTFVLIGGLILSACSQTQPPPATGKPAPAISPPPAAKTKIVLKGVTVFDPTRPQMKEEYFVQRVNERAKGELELQIIGGPEVIGMFDQPEALRKGSIDYLLTFAASYKSQVPETIVMSVSDWTPSEERKPGGYYQLLQEAHNRPKMGAHYLGRIQFGGFYWFGNKKVEKLADFKGQKVGVTSLWKPISEALGAVPVIVEEPDIYTAMDRRVIDAYIGPSALPKDFGIYKITKYAITPKFYIPSNMTHLVNLERWNSIPKPLQDLMDQVAAEIEPELYKWFNDVLYKEEMEVCTKGGMEVIELPAAEAKEYLRIANGILWDEVKPQVSPETYDKLKKLLIK